jgi:hypothetical protein
VPCKFDFLCKRADCYFFHPSGAPRWAAPLPKLQLCARWLRVRCAARLRLSLLRASPARQAAPSSWAAAAEAEQRA